MQDDLKWWEIALGLIAVAIVAAVGLGLDALWVQWLCE